MNQTTATKKFVKDGQKHGPVIQYTPEQLRKFAEERGLSYKAETKK